MFLLALLLLPITLFSADLHSDGLNSLNEPPISLNTQKITITDGYDPHKDSCNIARFLTPSLNTILVWWLKDRFNSAGKTGCVSFEVRHVRITETPCEKSGWFTAARVCFEADIYLEIRISQKAQTKPQTLTIHARTRSIESEQLNLFERQKVWINLLENAINNLDKELMQKDVFQSIVLQPTENPKRSPS